MLNQRLKLFIPLAIFVLLAILLWRGLSLDPNAMPSALVDKPVPQFYLPSLEEPDQYLDQSIFKGRVTLLNVWATWCPPCYVEHPFLVKLAERGVPIIGVNYKDEIAAAQKWIRDLHNPYVAIIRDADGRFGIDLGVSGWPETYLVDKKGMIRYKHIGVVDENVWEQTLQPLMQQYQ